MKKLQKLLINLTLVIPLIRKIIEIQATYHKEEKDNEPWLSKQSIEEWNKIYRKKNKS